MKMLLGPYLLLVTLWFSTAFAHEKYILDTSRTSKEVEPRIQFVILHFTHLNLSRSLYAFTHNNVSIHYLIPAEPIDGQNKIYHMVKDDLKAAHAGLSYWQGQYNTGQTNLNATSIGIELVNLGYKYTPNGYEFFPYPDYQIQLLTDLLIDLIAKYNIHPTRILGHSDITPNVAGRKINKLDPGPLFPWDKLAAAGIGAWYDREQVDAWVKAHRGKTVNIKKLQGYLATYGYKIEKTGVLDRQTIQVLKAFQMHFRPSDYSGKADLESFAIIKNLVERYFQDGKLNMSPDQGDAL